MTLNEQERIGIGIGKVPNALHASPKRSGNPNWKNK
jgi:hypothetical protein